MIKHVIGYATLFMLLISASDVYAQTAQQKNAIDNFMRLTRATQVCPNLKVNETMTLSTLYALGVTPDDLLPGGKYVKAARKSYNMVQSDIDEYGVKVFCAYISVNLSALLD